MSLDKDAKLVRNEGYVRHFALKHSKAKSEADDSYSLKVYAPGFAGQYSLRVVYFAATVDDQGKQKSREQACKLSVRKGQSSEEPAHEFAFSVEAHPGFDEQAFKKQRNQNVLRLFTMRWIPAYILAPTNTALAIHTNGWVSNKNRSLQIQIEKHGNQLENLSLPELKNLKSPTWCVYMIINKLKNTS